MSYLFHGIHVSVTGDGEAARLLHGRLEPFWSDTPQFEEWSADFHCLAAGEAHSVHPPAGAGRPIYDPPRGEVSYFAGADQVYIDFDDRVRALCDPASKRLSFSLRASDENAWMASHPLFTLCWIELLKRSRLFSIHASGVSRAGKALLLAGASGSGKTTLALALLRAGFGFLGDDMLFLRSDPNGLRVLSFPDETDVTPETLGMFPELAGAAVSKGSAGRAKRAIRAEAVYHAKVSQECEPVVLVFPRVVHGAPPVLIPIGAGEALLELSSNVLLTERRASQAHLDVLGRLAREARCYRVEVDRPDEVAALLGNLLGR